MYMHQHRAIFIESSYSLLDCSISLLFTRKLMVKLNDSFSGEGNAVLRVDEELQNALKDWSLYC